MYSYEKWMDKSSGLSVPPASSLERTRNILLLTTRDHGKGTTD